MQGHGLCAVHYTRVLRHGSTDDPRPQASDRFWSKVDQSGGPDACWTWKAKVNVWGYGAFWFEGREWFAHRWAYRQAHGEIAEGATIDHLCRNTRCVNPAHMEVVSVRDNILRGYGIAGQNARKTHCPKGHPYDAANTQWFGPQGRWRRCRKCARLRPADV